MTRSTLWFATAYTSVILIDEAARAFTPVGPVSSLIVGLAAWMAYRRAQTTGLAVPLLWLAASGISNGFGHLMSATFLGDSTNVAGWGGLPQSVRYGISLAGAAATAMVLFATGRELRRWMDPHWSRLSAMLQGVAVPLVLGTILVIVINQPVAISTIAGPRAAEAAVWLFAVLGAALAPPARSFDGTAIRAIDIAMAVAVVVVRLLVPGIAPR